MTTNAPLSEEKIAEMERTLSHHRCDCSKTSWSLRCRGRVCCELVHVFAEFRARVDLLTEQNAALEESARWCASCGQLMPGHSEDCGRWPLVLEHLQKRCDDLQASAAESEKQWTARWHATLDENEGLCGEIRVLEKQRDDLQAAKGFAILERVRKHLRDHCMELSGSPNPCNRDSHDSVIRIIDPLLDSLSDALQETTDAKKELDT